MFFRSRFLASAIRSFTLKEQIELCQRIARLSKTRLPLSHMLEDGTASQTMAKLQSRIDAGVSLSKALASGSSRDSRILAACVDGGERSGALGEMLEAWTAMHLGNSEASKSLRAALVYPSLLIMTALISLGYVAWYLIPEYRTTYVMFDHDMPWWLETVVRMRENLGPLFLGILVLMLLPIAIWWWRRRRFDSLGFPEELSRCMRLQALATELASYLVSAAVPMEEIMQRCTQVLGLGDSENSGNTEVSQVEYQYVRCSHASHNRAVQTPLVLASLENGILEQEEAAEHLQAVSKHLREAADATTAWQVRWLPMFVALVIGCITILTYALLIYMPWISLMIKISDLS